ncbi:MAG: Sjogren's syndrome/scleroderma autoantigen 1 family protein, partial [Candidatus Bathyarchaeia archaeon]
ASGKSSEEQAIKRMADLLRQGQTLTELACPVCASPIFRLKSGDLWCAKCEKKVIVVKEEEELTRIKSAMALENLEALLLEKIQEIQKKIQQENSVDELQKLSATLSELLDSLEKIRKAKRV